MVIKMKEEFSRLAKIIGSDKVDNFKNKTVCIVGVGGVGGYTIESLARSGIGTLILVDFDTVDITNINRQIIALHSTIGRKKIEVWKERILDINPNCNVILYDLFYSEECKDSIFEHSIDFLVDACDTMSAKKLLILECIKREIPFLSSMGTGNKIDPSKLEITELSKTSYDPLARILRKWKKEEQITKKIPVLYSTEIPIKTQDSTPGSTAFVPSSAGLLISSYIIKFFLEQKRQEMK